MNKVKCIKSLCEYIWSIEEQYGLLDFEVNGVKPWQSMRMEIYYFLAQELEFYSLPHTIFSFKEKVINFFDILKNSIIFNPFFAKPSNVVVFPHSRTKLINGEYIDIYTHYLVQELLASNYHLTVFESFHLGQHNASSKVYKKYMDFFSFSNQLIKLFFITQINESQQNFLNIIENDILINTGIKINLKNKIKSHIKTFKTLNFQYKILLKKINPKTIYLVVSYAQAPLIKAAKDCGIRVIELQHGTFSQFHLGYSFPKYKKSLDYFPDEIYVWNDFWKTMLKFPIPNSHIKHYGFKYLDSEKTKYSHIEKIKNRIIFLSQGALGNSFASILLEKIHLFKDLDIHYKLHPGEYNRWHHYKALQKLDKFTNFHILTDCDLYEEFAKAEYMAGVFSTALYEGEAFNCHPILFDLPGIEYMNKFIYHHGLTLKKRVYLHPKIRIRLDRKC